MQRRPVEIIGAAWGMGGAHPGCAEAAGALSAPLREKLADLGVEVVRGPLLAPASGERRRSVAISRACGQLAAAVAGSLRAGRFPCVLGGDHSCAAGTWAGAARATSGNLGLLWIDAHMDSHTPATSPSGRMHGMPLAWLLGEDDDLLYGLSAAVVDPERVCVLGVHSYEREEAERLARLGVRVFFIEEVRLRGLAAVFDDALRIVTSGSTAYGVTVDMDALAPDDAPGVGVPVPGGIPGTELVEAMGLLRGDERLAALELVEYCPPRDREGRTAALALEIVAAALGPAGEQPQVLADALHGHQP